MKLIQNLQYVFALVGAFGSFVLGWIVLIKDSKKYQNICFFTFTLGLLLWSSFVLIHNLTGNLFWGRLIFVPVPLVIFSLWLFSYHFPVSGKKLFQNLFQSIVIFVIAPILTILGSTELILKDVVLTNNQLAPVKGILMDAYYLFFLGFILFAISNLLYKYFSSNKEERLKVQYFLLGIVGTIILLVLFLVVFPAVSGSYQSAFIAPSLILIMVITTAYSILKKRLWSLQYIIGEIIFYLLISVFGVLVFRIAMFIHNFYLFEMDIFLKLSIEFVMGILLGPLFLFLVEKSKFLLSKNFSFREWNYKQILKNINKITEEEISLSSLSEQISKHLLDHLEIKDLGILLWKEKSKEIIYKNGFILENERYIDLDPNIFSNIMNAMDTLSSEEMVFSAEELFLQVKNKELSSFLEFLIKNEIKLILRLTLQDDFGGFIFFGEKVNNDAFTREDYDFMNSLVSILNLSFSRSFLYEEIRNFNMHLQEEIQKATFELEKANKELRELDKAKDDLISIASHELRTPATIVKGKLYLLKGRIEKLKDCEGYNPKIEKDIEVCLSAIEREIEQVNTLLEASRIGKDTMVLDKQDYNLYDLIKQSVEDFQIIAKDKGLDLKVENNKSEEFIVKIDVRRIREVIDNLITNAIKYTENGSIILNIYKNNNFICVSVQDTGIGIANDKKDKLFTKFYRVRNDDPEHSKLVKPGGTGLGLFVAKNIIEKHNGNISLESEEGKGSTFTFCLPIEDIR